MFSTPSNREKYTKNRVVKKGWKEAEEEGGDKGTAAPGVAGVQFSRRHHTGKTKTI